MKETYDFEKIKKDLVEISNSKPYFKCKNCQENKPEKFFFCLENNIIKSSYKCYCSSEISNYIIKENYDSINSFEDLKKNMKHPSSLSPFSSTQNLFDYVQSKLKKNFEYKNKIIDRINRTSYLNTDNKIALSNKVIEGLNKNIEINIECYKILHFLIFNDIVLKEKGYNFPIDKHINLSYDYYEKFELVEKSVYQLLSYFSYQFLINLNYRHNYSIDNMIELNHPLSFGLTLFDGRIVGKTTDDEIFIISYHQEETLKEKKLIIEKKLKVFNSSASYIQLNNEKLCLLSGFSITLINLKDLNNINKIETDFSTTISCKLSNGKIVTQDYEEGNIYIYTINEKELEIKNDIILQCSRLAENESIEFQENKILFFSDDNLCIYNCSTMQYEYTFTDFCHCGNSYYLKQCLLPGNTFAFGNYQEHTLTLVDLYNPKCIAVHNILGQTMGFCLSESKDFIFPINHHKLLIFDLGKYVIDPFKPTPSKIDKEGITNFIENVSLTCDGRILVGLNKHFCLYNIVDKIEIERVGYSNKAADLIKSFKKDEKIDEMKKEKDIESISEKSCEYICINIENELVIATFDEFCLVYF